MQVTYTEDRKAAFEELVSRIGNWCKEHGLPFETEEIEIHYDKDLETNVTVVDVKLEDIGKDWRYVAYLEWVEEAEKNVISTHYEGVDLEAYRDRVECDECKTKHARKYTHIIQNKETGALMQVGSACLKYYFPRDHYLGFKEEIEAEAKNLMRGYWHINQVLQLAIRVIDKFGYVSITKAQEEMKAATVEVMWDEDVREALPPLTKEQDEMVEKVIKYWVEENEAYTEFDANMETIMQAHYPDPKYYGFIAYAYPGYKAYLAKQAENVYQYYGQPKDKFEDIEVKILDVKPIDGYYGMTYLYKMTDGKHLFVWFASKMQEYEAGEKVLLKGTVKQHSTFNEMSQTVVTRCKMKGV